jgi:hypothetical protein
MAVHSTHRRIGRTAAVVVAGTVFGVASTFAIANAERSTEVAPQKDATERAAVAEWARTQHLTGLSPASLVAVPDPVVESDIVAQLAAIAEFAREQGLTGLSPASMHTVDE